MVEGWYGDDYIILFSASEIPDRTSSYGIAEMLPGFRVLGLIGWDDFLVQDEVGATFRLATTPCDRWHLEALQIPDPTNLVADERFRGKIKWYLTPIVFEGDPNPGGNVIWVDHEKHTSLVRWWNAKYRKHSVNQV